MSTTLHVQVIAQDGTSTYDGNAKMITVTNFCTLKADDTQYKVDQIFVLPDNGIVHVKEIEDPSTTPA